MLELLLVLAGIVSLAVMAFITVVITPQIMIELGLWVLAGGLLIGIPTGFWYHVALYRQLAGRMTLPPRWWRAPVELLRYSHLLNSGAFVPGSSQAPWGLCFAVWVAWLRLSVSW